ncbi:flavodoxin domain containing protein [Babesia bovis T2Bo]|uniref:Flavodoxin domain containing protein n=1 Tax=Babesia bovis TaxID=5865 RepID=A7ARX0_BABBO|nr:flavodoxin domain containing protein [Babesia bovis T2Bo]EDO07289.1 flavodoxin domain containing protein [Babesia bovis T2Bo]|eukprot:XP_001610857.1 flavodoxin domain containing protein [Babesia bovis T2Bo]
MKVIVVYASETGCGEALAYTTYIELYKRGIDVKVRSACMVTLRYLVAFDRCIFIVSTAAFGEFPHNIHPLVDALRKRKACLSLSYTIFGLGDSKYPLYNYAARRLISVLNNFGGTCFYPPGYGDDQHPLGHLGEFIAWLPGLCKWWNAEVIYEPMPMKFALKVVGLDKRIKEGRIDIKVNMGTIKSNELITPEVYFSPVRNILVDFYGQLYDIGDVCRLYPTGNADEVAEDLKSLGYDPDEVVLIKRMPDGFEFNRDLEILVEGNNFDNDNPNRLPFEGIPIKLQRLFTEFLCLRNVCTQWQMYIMAAFARQEIHKNKLLEMSAFTIDACVQYNNYCKDEKRTLIEVLKDFHMTNLPLNVLVNIATPYYPRFLSIASLGSTIGIGKFFDNPLSPSLGSISYRCFKKFLNQSMANTGIMELYVGEVVHRTPNGRIIKGQASEMLYKGVPGNRFRFDFVNHGLARRILNINKPVLFISTGTGLAACKPLLESRIQMQITMWKEHFTRPKFRDLAFFGYRNRKVDQLYVSNFKLLNLWCDVHILYSRGSKQKVYVQDGVAKYPHRVLNILMNGTVIVTGRSNPMPKEVMQTLKNILVEHAGFETKAAEEYIEDAILGGRIVLETWG